MLIWNKLPLAGRWVSHYLVSSKHLCVSVSGNDESCSVTGSAALTCDLGLSYHKKTTGFTK